jgi:hypothetical protein
MKLTRRDFAKLTAMAGGALMLPWQLGRKLYAQIPGGTLPPTGVAKYVTPLAKPPVMRRTSKVKRGAMKNAEYYEIAVKQFTQQILPNVPGVPMANHPQTDVWSYGPANKAPTLANGYFYPAFTLEAKYNKPTVVKWVNGLVDNSGNYRPHLLPVDQTLHWANPAGPRDHRGTDPAPYTGPTPPRKATVTPRPGICRMPTTSLATFSTPPGPSSTTSTASTMRAGGRVSPHSRTPTTSLPPPSGITTTRWA